MDVVADVDDLRRRRIANRVENLNRSPLFGDIEAPAIGESEGHRRFQRIRDVFECEPGRNWIGRSGRQARNPNDQQNAEAEGP